MTGTKSDNIMQEDQLYLIEPEDRALAGEETTAPAKILNEGNLRMLPVFPLQKGRSKKFQSKDGLVIRVVREKRVDGAPGLTLWEVTGPLQPSDKAVFMAVESFITGEYLAKNREVPEWLRIPSYRLLLRHRGIQHPRAWDIEDLKAGLRRITRTTCHTEGAWRSRQIDSETGKATEEWISGDFHIYDSVWVRGETRPDGKEVVRGAVVALGREYRHSLNSNHIIPLDYELWRSLRNPVGRRLMEILSGKFYGLSRRRGKVLTQDYQELCEILPLEPQRYLSDARQSLRRAHAELVHHSFLAAQPVWEWSRDSKKVLYAPGSRSTRPVRLESAPVEQGSGEAPQNSLGEELTARGVTAGVAERLIRDFPEERIRRHLDIHDQELAAGVKQENPGGRLHRRITEDWTPFEGYKTPEQRQAADEERRRFEDRERAEVDRRATDEERLRQERAEWAAKPLEERARLRAERWRWMGESEVQKRYVQYLEEEKGRTGPES